GWSAFDCVNINVILASSENEMECVVKQAPDDSIHLCQGLRGNGLVRYAQKLLRQRKLSQIPMMESLEQDGFRGFLRKCLYGFLFLYWGDSYLCVLAIGKSTKQWLVNRGVSPHSIYDFSYFLNDEISLTEPADEALLSKRKFRFIFVGQFVPRKQLDVLIYALAELEPDTFELWVIGSGPLENHLFELAQRQLGNSVVWCGKQDINNVPGLIAQADCLVLPSWHDGWGAVVSESLMVGTPVICTSACGASVAVDASRVGAVVSNNKIELTKALAAQVEQGPWAKDSRDRLKNWAECLGANMGANYLSNILKHLTSGVDLPESPLKRLD
ncbi:glycosyltransferase, partial [Alphaproteobacteria bacterium]|nr:glycosyltransferase [Alphaproteobacteria bacterium]